jgi:hypothetical protein
MQQKSMSSARHPIRRIIEVQQNLRKANMTTPNSTSEYMLLFRGPAWDRGLSRDDLQERLDRVMAWFEGLKEQGRVKGGQPLGPENKIVSGKNSRTVADGPFAESKEAVGGFLQIEADSLDEAVAIAKSCPTLDYGITIEVRPLLEECPCFKRAHGQLALATA